MGKRITSILSLLLLTVANVAMADNRLSLVDYGAEPVTEFETGKYYLILTHPQDGSVRWMSDGGAKISSAEYVEGLNGAKLLWTITKDKTEDGVYYVQSATTGNYISIDGTSDGGAVTLKADESSVTIEYDEDMNYCAFKNTSGQYIDIAWDGTSPSSWSGGVAGSRRLIIYEAETAIVNEEEAALGELTTVVDKYGKYISGYSGDYVELVVGTDVGQYNVSQEVYDAFISDMNRAIRISLSEEDAPSVEEIRALIAAIEANYETIMNSIVPLTIADGHYRIVSAMEWTKTIRTETGELDENGDPIYDETTIHPTKAMYATMENKVMWATLDSTDCRYVWTLTNNAETGLIKVMNTATDGVINGCTQSAAATISSDSETEMYFEYIGRNDSGNVVIAFRPDGGGDYSYLHAGGHGGGAGESGSIVGWLSSASATQWILCPVSDEETAELEDAFAPVKNHELLVSNYQGLIAKADSALAIAKDDQYIATRGAGLITSGSQMSSPFSCSSDEEGGNGYTFDFVVDGKTDTYWHSTWSGGNVASHSHWFQVTLNEPIADATNLVAYIYRRTSAANDHITVMSVYGSDDSAALEDETEDSWTLIGNINTPWTNGQTEVTSNILTSNGAYSYLRFYIDDTAGSGISSTRGYAHMAEFQLYPVTIDGNTQYSQMGEVRTNLEAALALADSIDTDELTIDDYNALKPIVDAFVAAVVDPTALGTAIEDNKAASELVVIGDNPGQWPEGTEASSLSTLISEAKAYLKTGTFTQETVDKYVEEITTAAANIMESANKVAEGKWYSIRFASEEMYDTYGWTKSNAVNATLGDLYDTYVTPATVEDDVMSTPESLGDVKEGATLRFVSEDEISSTDLRAFRFLAQGDSAYVIQHKSGLFVAGASAGNGITLSATPALFDINAVGLGKLLLHTLTLSGADYGDDPVYLHAQNAGHSLVTWTASEVGSNSAILIEPIDESDLDNTDVAESIVRNVTPNSMRIWCYPSGFSVQDGKLYQYKGAYEDSEGAHFAFDEISEAQPGQPVLYVNGDIEQFNKDAEDVEEYLTLKSASFAPEALTDNGMHGTYVYNWADEGTIVVGGGDFAKFGNALVEAEGEDYTDCTRDITANTGYIIATESVIESGEYDLVLTISDCTSIAGVETGKASLSDVIYNLSGQRVVKAQKGVYIIGGKKTAVK